MLNFALLARAPIVRHHKCRLLFRPRIRTRQSKVEYKRPKGFACSENVHATHVTLHTPSLQHSLSSSGIAMTVARNHMSGCGEEQHERVRVIGITEKRFRRVPVSPCTGFAMSWELLHRGSCMSLEQHVSDLDPGARLDPEEPFQGCTSLPLRPW